MQGDTNSAEYNNNLTVAYEGDIQIYNLNRLVNLTIELPEDETSTCFSVKYELFESSSCNTPIESTIFVEIQDHQK